MPYTLERHREYIRITNDGKPYSELTSAELKIIRAETHSFRMLDEVEAELKRRKAIKNTHADVFAKMGVTIRASASSTDDVAL